MWTIAALICLAIAFAWLALKFREVGPLMEELKQTRAENLQLQEELKQTRESLQSCQNAIENNH